mmetsp:Transcript_1320/g.4189  ORF Transcript_1320/g.4189 Transcript_1320/m.4189 type:complete len:460 (+) Transcript_1320:703-2082(+)
MKTTPGPSLTGSWSSGVSSHRSSCAFSSSSSASSSPSHSWSGLTESSISLTRSTVGLWKDRCFFTTCSRNIPTVKREASSCNVEVEPAQTKQCRLGASSREAGSSTSRLRPDGSRLHTQYRQASRSPRRTLSASSTMKPAMMAFVVAIAGMMLPAISLTSHRDWSGMWKTAERRLAAAVTKSRASGSSLSKESEPTSAVLSVRMRSMDDSITAAHSGTVQARCSTSASGAASGRLSEPSTTLTGGVRSFQSVAMLSSRSTSASKTVRKMRSAYCRAVSPGCRCSGGGAAAPGPLSSPSGCSSEVSTRSVSSPPKIFLKSSSLAQAMQCTGLSGWLRTVQIGYDFGGATGSHSKHFVRPLRMARTCPTYPMVPLSMSGLSVARHTRLTCRRASTLSSALSTMSNVRKKSGPKRASLMLPCSALMSSPSSCGNSSTASRATSALGRLTWCARKRNWRLRLE